jgi:DNA polymerase-3 subunit gamma/tau
MSYLVLARKYRPQRFADVAGQEHVTRTLLNALRQNRIAHGYIFSGHRGIGKTTIARILAMALNCRTPEGTPGRPTPEPCGICESCTEIRAGNSVDVIEIDAATNRGIDEIRELREAARYRPARDRYKIYILDEAHQITDAAFNALLKTLEEPPDHVIFMMATTQPEDIPQTIRSRCQHFSFHAVSFEQILAQLQGIAAAEKIVADNSSLGLLAEAGDGSLRDALSIMDQAIASADTDADGHAVLTAEQVRELMGNVPSTVFETLMEAVSSSSAAAVLTESNRLLNAGHSPQELARQFTRYLRNCLMTKIAGADSELLQVSGEERERARRTALLFSEEDLARFLQILLRAFDELGYRQEQRFHFELALLKLVHAQRLLPLEQILSGASASGPTPAAVPSVPLRGAVSAGAPAPRPAIPARAVVPVEAPGFSPFETDRRRKDAQGSSSIPAVTAQSVSGSSAALATEGSLALAPTAEPEYEPEAVSESPVSETSKNAPDEATLRSAITVALEKAGHASAAHTLAAAQWSATESGWRVEVPVSEKMLSVVLPPNLRRIAQDAAREAGAQGAKLQFEAAPQAQGAAGAQLVRPQLTTEGLQHEALQHPLVQKARELFQAEVRSVVDLRAPAGRNPKR